VTDHTPVNSVHKCNHTVLHDVGISCLCYHTNVGGRDGPLDIWSH